MQTFDLGDAVPLELDFANSVGNPSDPDELAIVIEQPDGTRLSYDAADPAVAHPQTGSYRLTFVPTMPGPHAWSASGTGQVQAAERSRFYVRGTA